MRYEYAMVCYGKGVVGKLDDALAAINKRAAEGWRLVGTAASADLFVWTLERGVPMGTVERP